MPPILAATALVFSNIVQGPDEQCGVQDPRITVDKQTGTYVMAYTAYGSRTHACDHNSCGLPTSQCPQTCSYCCTDTVTKVAVSQTLEPGSWRRLNRTGDPGFDAKSAAILIRETAPHYQYTGEQHRFLRSTIVSFEYVIRHRHYTIMAEREPGRTLGSIHGGHSRQAWHVR